MKNIIDTVPGSLCVGFEMQMMVAERAPGLETCKAFSVSELLRVYRHN